LLRTGKGKGEREWRVPGVGESIAWRSEEKAAIEEMLRHCWLNPESSSSIKFSGALRRGKPWIGGLCPPYEKLRVCRVWDSPGGFRRAVFVGRTQSAGSFLRRECAAFQIFADSAGRGRFHRPANTPKPCPVGTSQK
jgi:hypothetical protein